MSLIDIQNTGCKYTAIDKTFHVSGKKVRFDTDHTLFNPDTQKGKNFKLSHSTGSEWDPKTIWVYKSEDGMILNILNDDVTEQDRQNYLDHKTGK